jgi:hypothetical protein
MDESFVEVAATVSAALNAGPDRRTAGDLLRLVHAHVEERARLFGGEAARREAEDEANRSRHLDQLGSARKRLDDLES